MFSLFENPKPLVAYLKSLTRQDRPHGKLHVKADWLSRPWIFHDSGRFAATIIIGHSKECYGILRIIIYDCLDKEAFDYFDEGCDFEPTLCYWYGELLVLLSLGEDDHRPRVLCFELDHSARNVRLSHYKYPNIDQPFRALSVRDAESMQPVVMGDVEYMSLPIKNKTIILIPKNPFTDLPCKEYSIDYPEDSDIVNGIAVMYKHILLPILCENYAYLLRRIDRDGYSFFRLDSLVQVDISKLRNTLEDDDDIEDEQDLFAFSEVHLQNTNGYDDQFFHTDRSSSPSMTPSPDGSQVDVYFYDTPDVRSKYSIDLKKKSWRKTKEDNASVYGARPVCLHPFGSTVRIDYGTNDKLFIEEVKSTQISMPTLQHIAMKKVLLGTRSDEFYKDPRFIKKFF